MYVCVLVRYAFISSKTERNFNQKVYYEHTGTEYEIYIISYCMDIDRALCVSMTLP